MTGSFFYPLFTMLRVWLASVEAMKIIDFIVGNPWFNLWLLIFLLVTVKEERHNLCCDMIFQSFTLGTNPQEDPSCNVPWKAGSHCNSENMTDSVLNGEILRIKVRFWFSSFKCVMPKLRILYSCWYQLTAGFQAYFHYEIWNCLYWVISLTHLIG